MDLTIVIVSYNTKELLRDCLNSIKNQEGNLKYEVFVVDNNSHDSSQELVKKNYEWVNLIENKENLGFSKANNIALKKAKGKYVLVLNPDTKLEKDTIFKMYNFMEDQEDVAVSTCKVLLANEDLDKDCRRHFPTPKRALFHFLKLGQIFKGSRIFDDYYMGYMDENKMCEVDSCVGAFMFIRSAALKKVGYFDEEFFFYGEDLDLCFRLKEAGYKIVYTPITKITHYKGAASGIKQTTKKITKATKESRRKALGESVRAMEIFYKKHFTNIYPFFINWLVLISLKLLKKYRTLFI